MIKFPNPSFAFVILRAQCCCKSNLKYKIRTTEYSSAVPVLCKRLPSMHREYHSSLLSQCREGIIYVDKNQLSKATEFPSVIESFFPSPMLCMRDLMPQ
jgi:hypothetical protein